MNNNFKVYNKKNKCYNCNYEHCECSCKRGKIGRRGYTGPAGPMGPTGIIHFSDFYALMPPDNSSTIAIGGDIEFPNTGVSNGIITLINSTSFNLPNIGIYEVLFQVSVNEAAQLGLTLNGLVLQDTVVTGTNQVIGLSLIKTTVVNSILTVKKFAENSSALTVGTSPVSARLIIKQLC